MCVIDVYEYTYCTLCASVISVRMAGVGVIGYWEKCKCNMSTCM